MSNPRPAKKACPPSINDEASSSSVHLTASEIRTVKIQFQKDLPTWSRFDDLLDEYCRFMQIKISEPDHTFAPSYLIDRFWHAHILSTREYMAFCNRHNNGILIHHDPTMRCGQDRYAQTLDRYETLFKETIQDQEIWPANVDTKFQVASEREENSSGQDDDEDEDSYENSYDDSYEYDSDEFDEDEIKYLREFGGERGRTREELIEWHKEAIQNPENNEGFDPAKDLDTCNCYNLHRWYDGEFDLGCHGCRTSSEGLGGFTCG